jgi:hypothetical protein
LPDEQTAETQINPTQKFLNLLTISSTESFQLFTQRIAKHKEIALSIGVARNQKNREVIGANLLGKQEVDTIQETHKFQFDKYFYIDSLCFNFEKNNVCHLKMQEIEGDLVGGFLRELLVRDDVIISMVDAKEQLKVLFKVFPGIEYQLNGKVQDPKIVNWLMDPDADLDYHKMVEQFAPKLLEPLNLIACNAGKMSLGLNCRNGVEPKFRAGLEAFLTSEMTKQLIVALGKVNKGHLVKVSKGNF